MKNKLITKLLILCSFFMVVPSTFAAPCMSPTVTTDKSDTVTSSSAIGYGTMTNNGGLSCNQVQSGIVYSTDSTFVTGVSTTTLGAATVDVQFNSTLSPLSESTLYYFRAYAQDSSFFPYGYGTTLNFTTSAAGVAPTNQIKIRSGTVGVKRGLILIR